MPFERKQETSDGSLEQETEKREVHELRALTELVRKLRGFFIGWNPDYIRLGEDHFYDLLKQRKYTDEECITKSINFAWNRAVSEELAAENTQKRQKVKSA